LSENRRVALASFDFRGAAANAIPGVNRINHTHIVSRTKRVRIIGFAPPEGMNRIKRRLVVSIRITAELSLQFRAVRDLLSFARRKQENFDRPELSVRRSP
jgi:hypothetical protein